MQACVDSEGENKIALLLSQYGIIFSQSDDHAKIYVCL